jgi:long-subunit acyl-CoA synthetase (AMP-forming)
LPLSPERRVLEQSLTFLFTGPTSAGLPTFVTTLKIVDEHDTEVPTGSVGEILVHGVSRTYGYWRNEKATKEAFTADGYYRT